MRVERASGIEYCFPSNFKGAVSAGEKFFKNDGLMYLSNGCSASNEIKSGSHFGPKTVISGVSPDLTHPKNFA